MDSFFFTRISILQISLDKPRDVIDGITEAGFSIFVAAAFVLLVMSASLTGGCGETVPAHSVAMTTFCCCCILRFSCDLAADDSDVEHDVTESFEEVDEFMSSVSATRGYLSSHDNAIIIVKL